MTPAGQTQHVAGHACQCCASGTLHEIAGFSDLPRVTSDSKPFAAGGRLFVCTTCGLTQKIADAQWLQEIAAIYGAYEMNHQGDTPDQVVFDPVSGVPSGRCELLTRRVKDAGLLPLSGQMLDVGTGSGAMVSAFSPQFPGWTLYGLDLDDRRLASLQQIPRFAALFTCEPRQLDRQFNLVTLIHALEHFVQPAQMLRDLRERLAPQGRLLVEVNNADETPFDLIVADHLCHFNASTLGTMAAQSGLGIETLSTAWLKKELSLVATAGLAVAADTQAMSAAAAQAMTQTTKSVAWLKSLLAQGMRLACAGGFGIFGTSVAATWLAGVLGDRLQFFVDEDPARVGRTHLGRPVYSPAGAPAGAAVYLAFPEAIAQSIAQRHAALPLRLELPQATA